MTTQRRLGLSPFKLIVWAILSLPAAIVLWKYAADTLTYGGVIHQTGLWSAGFLALVLCVTPVRRVWPKAKISRSLMRHRRAIGVASFGYAGLHTAVYLWRKVPLGKVLEEASRLEIMTGWIAFAIFAALAITSNNQSVKALGRRWQTLHRTVYIAAALTALHWALATLDYGAAAAFAGFIAAAELVRLLRRRKLPPR